MPGLYFASMSQVYPWDRGTNFAVEIRAAGGEVDAGVTVIRSATLPPGRYAPPARRART